ncbi:hypothetical protein AVEN_233814-1 [Araneus ventricosus]|uniref:Uncharacterized protein n=1 Tax=Araneus ventricosus TaxID=182803 RepID=A0A4Y2WCZ9_ARAVE|nr:hypothetical protein AVEN_233814-1 [Araneus ventricosus]
MSQTRARVLKCSMKERFQPKRAVPGISIRNGDASPNAVSGGTDPRSENPTSQMRCHGDAPPQENAFVFLRLCFHGSAFAGAA